jgi:cell division protein FtsA
MAIPPVVALEIGTTKVLALVGEIREDGHIMVTGIGEQPSAGVRKGEVIDLENAVTCVRSVLATAEETGKVSIRQVHLAISGGHIQTVVSRGMIPVRSKNREIGESDVSQVKEVARSVNLPADREIIHSICQHFCIDDQEQVLRPEGMEGAKLSLDMLVLHGIRGRMNNIAKVVRSVPMGVQDVAFSGLCSALSVLTPEQKKSGVIVIDLGGGTTDYVAYADDVLAVAGALGIGGDHITNDIAMAFNIPTSQAESVKREHGSAMVEPGSASKNVDVPPEVGFPGRSICLKSLQMVVNARTDEMLGMIRRRIEKDDLLHHIGAGVVLTGGGANMKGITRLAEKMFGLPCSVGRPRNISGMAVATSGPEYATCSGLIQLGFKMMAEQSQHRSMGDWFKQLFWK